MSKVHYNKKEKILSIKLSNESSADSEVRGNVVVDYNQEGLITNIDIMSFSLDEFREIKKFQKQPILAERFSFAERA